jgi:hypothetical protein
MSVAFVMGCRSGDGTVRVDAGPTFQTIRGWEATAFAGDPNRVPEAARMALLDSAVALGITRLRVEVRSGVEQTADQWMLRQTGAIEQQTYRCSRYAMVNDNDDPRLIDWNGFHFSEFDRQMEDVVLPFVERMTNAGQRLDINVNYVGFACPGDNLHADEPEEYAEFALATHLYLRDKYGLVPDSWEMVLEPDNGVHWTPEKMAAAVAATGRVLEANGFGARLVAPSTMSMGAGLDWVEAILENPAARRYLAEISYHRYRATGAEVARRYGEHAASGIPTSMLEWIGASHETLLEDLTVAQVSTWQQFTLGDRGEDRGAAYFQIEERSDGEFVVRPASRTRYLRPMFTLIRPGAVRVAAEADNRAHTAAAFVNADGRSVVLVSHARSGHLQVVGLVPGTYTLIRVTDSAYEESVVDVADAAELTLRGRGLIVLAGPPTAS